MLLDKLLRIVVPIILCYIYKVLETLAEGLAFYKWDVFIYLVFYLEQDMQDRYEQSEREHIEYRCQYVQAKRAYNVTFVGTEIRSHQFEELSHFSYFFLPKSAGISPHSSVCQVSMALV